MEGFVSVRVRRFRLGKSCIRLRKGYRPRFRFTDGERIAALPAFLKLKVDHKTVLCRDTNTYRALRDFLLNSGYSPVYETERVGEEKTAMATFACLNPMTGERLAVVQRDYDADKVGGGGTQFVQNTVKSLYVSKQEEFREWEKTGKKRKFLDGVPEKEQTKLLHDILVNTEPKGYVETVAPITRHVKLT